MTPRRSKSLLVQTTGRSALEERLACLAVCGFVQHYPLPIGKRRTADWALPWLKLAIFVDGCFWHGCPEHGVVPKNQGYDWAAKLAKTRARDLETTALLRLEGWTVLRIWEHDLR